MYQNSTISERTDAEQTPERPMEAWSRRLVRELEEDLTWGLSQPGKGRLIRRKTVRHADDAGCEDMMGY